MAAKKKGDDGRDEYVVKEPIRFKNKRREIGATVDMTEDEAAGYGTYVEKKPQVKAEDPPPNPEA